MALVRDRYYDGGHHVMINGAPCRLSVLPSAPSLAAMNDATGVRAPNNYTEHGLKLAFSRECERAAVAVRHPQTQYDLLAWLTYANYLTPIPKPDFDALKLSVL